jgi:outer membrane protein assembly factor BamB
VVAGRVYVNDRLLAPGARNPENPFAKASTPGKERLLCLDAATGKRIWEYEYDCTYKMSYPAGPRATPAVSGGKVYSLGGMGDLLCLDAATGKLLWSKNFIKDFGARLPIWGFAAHPLVDGNKLICLSGGKKGAVLALDKDTGKELWQAVPLDKGDPGYCPPMIYTIGERRQLIAWTPESVSGLDPETGAVLWTSEWAIRAGLSVPTPRLVKGNQLFLTAFYDGCKLLEISGTPPRVKEVWARKGRSEQKTDGLHSIMPTPYVQGENVYGVCSYGELRCLSLVDGKRLWSDLRATGYTEPVRWANAFLTPQGERFFLFNEVGDLIIARLSPKGYEEIDRAHILDPTYQLGGGPGGDRKVLWSHPAYAGKTLFARNDKEIVAVSLAADGK